MLPVIGRKFYGKTFYDQFVKSVKEKRTFGREAKDESRGLRKWLGMKTIRFLDSS